MNKTSYKVLTLTVGCMLLLSVTAEQAFAWTCRYTGCPDCQICRSTGCERLCSPGVGCCGGSCCSNMCCDGTCCGAGQDCCEGKCYNPATYKCCIEGTGHVCLINKICCEGDCCDPDNCETCVGEGNCEDCSRYGPCYECLGGYCMCLKECCEDSDCPNPSCQECVGCQCQLKAGAECAHWSDCEPCYDCVNCNCVYECSGDECCDGTCVPRCDPDGGDTCTWTNPPVYDPLCEFATPEMPFCINPDKTCNWEPTSGPGLNAACAPCDPGCSLGSTYCVILKPILCTEGLWPLPPFYMCKCIKEPDLYDPEEAGTRYICP